MAVYANVVVLELGILCRHHYHCPAAIAVRQRKSEVALAVRFGLSVQAVAGVVEQHDGKVHKVYFVLSAPLFQLAVYLERLLYRTLEVEVSLALHHLQVIPFPSLHEHQQVGVHPVLGIVTLKIVLRIPDIPFYIACQQIPGGDALVPAARLGFSIRYRQRECRIRGTVSHQPYFLPDYGIPYRESYPIHVIMRIDEYHPACQNLSLAVNHRYLVHSAPTAVTPI